MRLTRFGVQGLALYALLSLAFFAAPYSNLFFGLLGFLTLLILEGVRAARHNVRGISASFPTLAPLPSESEVRVPLVLEAPRHRRFQLSVRLELAGGATLRGHFDELYGETRLEVRTAGLPRGCHAIRGAWIESLHPFGLVHVVQPLNAPAELIVYPAPRSLEARHDATEGLDELLGRGDANTGATQPASLREHRPEDGARRVHWRASARAGRLVVQDWEGGSGAGLEVLLDRRSAPEPLEEALTTISTLVELARANKETLRIQSQGLSATFGANQRPWSEALRFLAAAEALPPEGPPPPPASPQVARLPLMAAPTR